MSNEELEKILRTLNKDINSFPMESYLYKVSHGVMAGDIWTMIDGISITQKKYKTWTRASYYVVFCTKLKKHVSIVLDMESDLHAYTLPEYRGQLYLLSYMPTILTLFRIREKRDKQRVTIASDNLSSIKLTEKLGAKISKGESTKDQLVYYYDLSKYDELIVRKQKISFQESKRLTQLYKDRMTEVLKIISELKQYRDCDALEDIQYRVKKTLQARYLIEDIYFQNYNSKP